MTFELLMLGSAILLLLGILASKLSSSLGIPAMVLFLVVGMLAGSEGAGGIYFNDPNMVQSIGVLALAYILFSGGLDTTWRSVRPVLKEGLLLSTFGVILTALAVGWFVRLTLGFSWFEGLLLGAIVSSTDAAAVFAVLRSRNVRLKGELRPLLELESGSNDPMAVFLTVGIISLMNNPGSSLLNLVPLLFWQMGLGILAGYVMGRAAVQMLNWLNLEYEGLYSVFTLSLVPLMYALTSLGKGNGFMAVYVAGIVMSNSAFVQKKSLLRFHDGLAWLMQIVIFMILGLQVFPSQLVQVMLMGLLVAAFLMFVARPVSVMLVMTLSSMSLRQKGLVSWVGLRGAVPIVLGTFPLLAGIEKSAMIFNLVFFIVLTSALLQGSTIPLVARWLGLEDTEPPEQEEATEGSDTPFKSELSVIRVAEDSPLVGRQIVELCLPPGVLIVYIQRESGHIVPGGNTVVLAGDVLHLFADDEALAAIGQNLQPCA